MELFCAPSNSYALNPVLSLFKRPRSSNIVLSIYINKSIILAAEWIIYIKVRFFFSYLVPFILLLYILKRSGTIIIR